MIRIETTAKFDAEGRFTVTGQTAEPISAGEHPIAIEISDTLATPPSAHAAEPMFIERDGLLFLNAKPSVGVVVDIAQLIEQQRDERERQLLGGCSE